MANCPFCGVEVQEGVKFCTNCGASLESVESKCNEPAPAQPPIETPVQQVVSEQPYQQPQEVAQQPYGQAAPGAQQAYQQPQEAAQQAYQQPQPAQFAPGQAAPAQAAPVDSGSIGWAILGFLIPLAGIILFLVWNKTKPKTAKMACIGAAAGFALALIINVLTNMNI